jgi:hypothetical protein
MVPDELFDEHLSALSGAELKALLYIVRRTFGFKKDSDNISLNQLLTGITTKGGKRLDSGTGLSRSSLVAALKGLVEKNLIISEHRVSSDRGNEPTNYRLNVLYPSTKIELGESENRTRLVRKSNPQETVLQQTEEQETDHTNIRMAPIFSEKSPKTDANSQSCDPQPDNGQDKAEDFVEENDEDREIIREYVHDFGRELGDKSKLRSSVSRAYNLFRKSGVSREAFIARMYEAKSITQERTADIRNRQPDDGKVLPAKSKMGYWFGTLSNLLDGKVPPRRRQRQETPEPITP